MGRERRGDEGARAAPSLEVTLGQKLPVRLEHRDARNTELARQIAGGRHRVARPELAGEDASAEGAVDLAVERGGMVAFEGQQSGHVNPDRSGHCR